MFGWYAAQDGAWQRWIARGYGLGVVVLILLQGAAWWRMKLRLLMAGQRLVPPRTLAVYQRWRGVNWWLIALFPVVALAGARLTGQRLITTDAVLGLLFLGGAVLEQINYYYYQLMYDSRYDWAHLRTHRRLRRGTVALALERQRRAAG